MILAALLLQAVAPPPKPPEPRLKAIDSAVAIDLFRQACWDPLADPAAVQAAIASGRVPLVLQPSAASGRPDVWRGEEAILTYLASDTLPPGIPPRQCTLRVRLSGAADQLILAGKIGDAFAITGASTRTRGALSTTEWRVSGDDGRTRRLFVTTRAAESGGTDLRLQALLLAGN